MILVLSIGCITTSASAKEAQITLNSKQPKMPYADTIKYKADGSIDGEYYTEYQQSMIEQFEKKAERQIKAAGDGAIAKANAVVRPGDVFITLNNNVFGNSIILVGHASLAKTYGGTKTLTSYGSGGVQIKSNEWKNRRSYYAMRVAYTSDALAAATVNNAEKKYIGKRYNWNYLNKFSTSSFYCSQLVWRAWLDSANINIDAFPYDTWVAPVEIALSSRMGILYYVA